MESAQRDAVLKEVLGLLAKKCVRLRKTCYWAGASAIALEELHHRQSFDLDFHTQKALADVRPILAEIQRAFPGMFEVVSAPDEFGTGFKGVLRLPGAAAVTLEVLSNFEDVPSEALVRSTIAPRFRRISLQRFLAAWNEATIRDDLAPYRDVDPAEALGARNLLLEWLRTEGPA